MRSMKNIGESSLTSLHASQSADGSGGVILSLRIPCAAINTERVSLGDQIYKTDSSFNPTKNIGESGLTSLHASQSADGSGVTLNLSFERAGKAMDEDWEGSMTRRMKDAHRNRWRQDQDTISIFRVPRNIRWCNFKSYDPNLIYNSYYDPKFVSIGPYHHGKPDLQQMEKYKWGILHAFLSKNEGKISLERCLEEMEKLEIRARSCYSEPIGMSKEEFVEMMLLDGCFIVFLLVVQNDVAMRLIIDALMKDELEGDGGPIANGQMIWELAMKDWLLLENQIPFFVVKKVFQLFITRIYVVDHSLEELAINALEGNWYMGKRDSPPTVPDGGEEVHHLLHLFYLTILPPVTQPGRSEYSSRNPIMAFKLKKKVNNVVHKLHCCHLLPPFRRQGTSLEGQDNTPPPPPPPEWFPSATSLKESWVKLKVINNARSFLDVKFHGGVMKIPTLLLHDNSELTLRNLIAFEQCYLHTGLHVSHYAIFMECLINSSQDVSILQEEEIILNHLGSEEEAARLFNKLAMEVTGDMTKNHLLDVYVKVNKFCRKRMNKWRATLVHTYFRNPWSIISFGAAVFLLILTLLQTFFAMYSYFHPPS